MMCPTLLQFVGTVVKASAPISFPASTSQSLNSTFNFPSLTNNFPVTNAWALINLQSSNRGLRWAISGFWTKASFLSGLNNPVALKFFSTIEDIFSPNSLIFIPSKASDLISTCNGDTAIGRGSRLPLVISTSISARALLIRNIFKFEMTIIIW